MMKRKSLFWFIIIALVVPMIAISCNNKKSYLDDDDDSDESSDSTKSKTEQVEDNDTKEETKEEKKLIFGEYKLKDESVTNFFGEDIVGNAKAEGVNLDLETSFIFNDDDELDCQIFFNTSTYFREIRNTMKMDLVFSATGHWNHDQANKQLTITLDEIKLDDVELKFAKQDATTKQILAQFGGEEGVKKAVMKEMNVESEMEKVKGTQVFTITRLQPDGFTIKPLDSEKRVKFDKVTYDE